MQILPGLHQIVVDYKGRPLQLCLLRYGNESLLMDVGDNAVPAKDVVPYFRSIGLDPAGLTYVLLTHPDIDHVGGVHAMQALAPQAKFLCGTLDREQIETPEGLAHIRARAHYHWHGLGPDDAKLAAFIANSGGAGRRLAIAGTLDGGERIRLGEREIEILHVPGHSRGHLAVYLPWENAAIIGDAVHGTANRFFDGRAAFACTYMYVDQYIGTIERLKTMRLDKLFSCHWPNCLDNAAVEKFLDESKAYALMAEAAIAAVVREAGETGVTLREVCLRAKPALGNWPAEKDTETRSMACGHLQRLEQVGALRHTEERPTRYVWESAWKGLR